MKNYISHHPWKIIEEGFHPEYNQISESLFSIGNARFGQRGNFEEQYSGQSLQGSYLAGVYYPDKTKVGWWKNGYPEYFAKVLNNCNWIYLDLRINGNSFDLAQVEILDFYRELDMKTGILHRRFTAKTVDGILLKVSCNRFCSFANKDLAALEYNIEILEGQGTMECDSMLDFDIRNQDSNYQENFWTNYHSTGTSDIVFVQAETRKTAFKVAASAQTQMHQNDKMLQCITNQASIAKLGHHFALQFEEGDKIRIEKLISIQ